MVPQSELDNMECLRSIAQFDISSTEFTTQPEIIFQYINKALKLSISRLPKDTVITNVKTITYPIGENAKFGYHYQIELYGHIATPENIIEPPKNEPDDGLEVY